MEKWRRFFQTYRIIEIKDDKDLLYQVGTTVGGKPISEITASVQLLKILPMDLIHL